MTDRAILNVAFGSWYPRGQDRLIGSLDAVGYRGEMMFWRDGMPAGSPSHDEFPYGFKPHALRHAADAGVELALWLDASCWAVKPVDPIFDWLSEHDVLLLEDGWTIGQFCSDAALSTLGCRDREEALTLPMCYALMIGVNLRTAKGKEFVDRWCELSLDGVTFAAPLRCYGEQSAASALAWQMGISMYRDWLPFFALPDRPRAEEAIILGQGMV